MGSEGGGPIWDREKEGRTDLTRNTVQGRERPGIKGAPHLEGPLAPKADPCSGSLRASREGLRDDMEKQTALLFWAGSWP